MTLWGCVLPLLAVSERGVSTMPTNGTGLMSPVQLSPQFVRARGTGCAWSTSTASASSVTICLLPDRITDKQEGWLSIVRDCDYAEQVVEAAAGTFVAPAETSAAVHIPATQTLSNSRVCVHGYPLVLTKLTDSEASRLHACSNKPKNCAALERIGLQRKRRNVMNTLQTNPDNPKPERNVALEDSRNTALLIAGVFCIILLVLILVCGCGMVAWRFWWVPAMPMAYATAVDVQTGTLITGSRSTSVATSSSEGSPRYHIAPLVDTLVDCGTWRSEIEHTRHVKSAPLMERSPHSQFKQSRKNNNTVPQLPCNNSVSSGADASRIGDQSAVQHKECSFANTTTANPEKDRMESESDATHRLCESVGIVPVRSSFMSVGSKTPATEPAQERSRSVFDQLRHHLVAKKLESNGQCETSLSAIPLTSSVRFKRQRPTPLDTDSPSEYSTPPLSHTGQDSPPTTNFTRDTKGDRSPPGSPETSISGRKVAFGHDGRRFSSRTSPKGILKQSFGDEGVQGRRGPAHRLPVRGRGQRGSIVSSVTTDASNRIFAEPQKTPLSRRET